MKEERPNRRTDNTMAKSKRKKAQLVIYKTLHRILLQIGTFYYSPKYLKGHVKWLRLKGSWISIYQCNQCLSPLKLMRQIPECRGLPAINISVVFYGFASHETYPILVCQRLDQSISLFSLTNKSGHHDIIAYIVENFVKHP